MRDWRDAQNTLASALNFKIEHAQVRYFRALGRQVVDRSTWLDLGCGHQIVPDWVATLAEQSALVCRTTLVGMDIDPGILANPLVHHRVMGVGERIPFRDASFDLVTANMVVEHLAQPTETFREIGRVLKPGGRFLFHTPNLRSPYVRVASWLPDGLKRRAVWRLEQRKETDVFHTYYLANTVEAVRQRASDAGLTVDSIEVGGSVGSFRSIGPLGVLEVPFLKLLSMPSFRRWEVTIIAVLRRAV